MLILLILYAISFFIVCSGNRSLQKELNESRRNESTACDALRRANDQIERNAINHCAEIAELQGYVTHLLVKAVQADEQSKKNTINRFAEIAELQGEDFIEQCRRNT